MVRGLLSSLLLLRSTLLSTALTQSRSCPRPDYFNNIRANKKFLSAMAYSIIERGSRNGEDYRIYYQGPNGIVSPWHDIPLWANKEENIFNMIVEIPRWTNSKMEMSTTGKMNYIKQDVKKGKLRFVANVFPHHGYIWNYGAFPQTWEDPSNLDQRTNASGDNDPLDICEIGDKVHARGAVIQVKVLGVMAMIDEGETDWKVLVIDVNDPLASEINDVEDIAKHKPGLLKATYEWFVLYKIPDGKPKNVFAFNGEPKNKDYALNIIEETHNQWKKLVMKEIDTADLSGDNVSVENSPFKVTADDALAALNSSAPAGEGKPLPDGLNKWEFVL